MRTPYLPRFMKFLKDTDDMVASKPHRKADPDKKDAYIRAGFRAMVVHELTHLFVIIPGSALLNEGLATFMEMEQGGDMVLREYKRKYGAERLTEEGFSEEIPEARHYCRGSLIWMYLYNRFGRETFVKAVRMLGNSDQGFTVLIKQITGESWDEFAENELRWTTEFLKVKVK